MKNRLDAQLAVGLAERSPSARAWFGSSRSRADSRAELGRHRDGGRAGSPAQPRRRRNQWKAWRAGDRVDARVRERDRLGRAGERFDTPVRPARARLASRRSARPRRRARRSGTSCRVSLPVPAARSSTSRPGPMPSSVRDPRDRLVWIVRSRTLVVAPRRPKTVARRRMTSPATGESCGTRRRRRRSGAGAFSSARSDFTSPSSAV